MIVWMLDQKMGKREIERERERERCHYANYKGYYNISFPFNFFQNIYGKWWIVEEQKLAAINKFITWYALKIWYKTWDNSIIKRIIKIKFDLIFIFKIKPIHLLPFFVFIFLHFCNFLQSIHYILFMKMQIQRLSCVPLYLACINSPELWHIGCITFKFFASF